MRDGQPSLGRDDSGGLLPRAGAGSGVRTGMILGLGRSLFSLKTLKWEVNILEMQDITKIEELRTYEQTQATI